MSQFEAFVESIDHSIDVSTVAETLVPFKAEASRVWDDTLGMDFVVRVAKNLGDKEKKEREQKEKPSHPFLPPFEDGLFVCDLDEEHRVLLNKFNVVDRHILLVSTEFKDQNSTMSLAMLFHVVFCVQALNGLAFHNHGRQSGASQPHLHIQVVPRCESDAIPDLPLTERMRTDPHLLDGVGCLSQFPIRHRAVRFRPDDFHAERVEQYYHTMLNDLGLTTESSYNFLLTAEYMMIVPRRASAYKGIGVNSIAFAGNMFLRDDEWLRLLYEEVGGPGQLLLQLGYPPDDDSNGTAIDSNGTALDSNGKVLESDDKVLESDGTILCST